MTSRFEATQAKYDKVTDEILTRGIHKRETERFIRNVVDFLDIITEFDEAL